MDARGHGVAAGVVVLLSFLGGLVTWRADVAGGYAAGYDRQGIVEALRYHGESERAEIEARTEQRTYVAYLAARQRHDAAAAVTGDPVAAVDATAETRIAERFARAFPETFAKDGAFDVAGRTAELLAEREVRDGSTALFARAEERKDARETLLITDLVLVVGLAAAMLGPFARRRRAGEGAVVLAVLALAYGAVVVVTVGF